MGSHRTLKLAVIGTLGGLSSGLFGVGGGVVMVPLIVLWLGYDERLAIGTSLTAIVVISTIGSAVHGVYGNVHVREGLLVGVPAVAGVVIGTELQQRISTRWLSLAFSLILTAGAIDLLRG